MKKVLFFICVALCCSWATFAQTEAPDSVQLTEDVQPPVVSYGSISYTNTYVALNTASVAYDWAVGKQVTVGGQVGIGIWLNSLLVGDSFIMNPAGFLQVRTRWYFDRLTGKDAAIRFATTADSLENWRLPITFTSICLYTTVSEQ